MAEAKSTNKSIHKLAENTTTKQELGNLVSIMPDYTLGDRSSIPGTGKVFFL
jgi:hypothetical protein